MVQTSPATRTRSMHTAAKTLVERACQALGYTIVPTRRLDRYPQTRFLSRFLSLLSVDCVFDVGGNKGQYGRYLRTEVGYRGTIVSFEPVPAALDKLREASSGDPKWVIRPYALGAKTGKAVFNVMAHSVFSSFLQPDNSRFGSFASGNRIVDHIDVEVVTLDEVFPEIMAQTSCSAPYLKLDTQGSDVDVANGGRHVISKFRGLQTEASVTPIYAGVPDFTESIKSFRQLGFEISAIFSLNPTRHFPRMIEFDCHMINAAYMAPDQTPPATTKPSDGIAP
jgi:FkbM family methyltransferase